MLHVTGLWLGGAGILALSFESLGGAIVFFTAAVLMLRYAP
jgi:hypothetical protein